MAVVGVFPQHTLHTILQEDLLSTEEAGFVLGQVFAALEYLHDKEWTHGNLDPRSIHVMSRKWLWVKLTDVSLSDYVDLGKPVGYHEIYAFEDYRDPNGCPADIWSAGVVALQLLSRHNLPSYDHVGPYRWAQKLENLATRWSQTYRNGTTAFVRYVLKYDSKKRPTATEVLNHPWIVQNRGECLLNNPHYNLYMPLRSRDTTPEPPISFGKQGISNHSDRSSHINFALQTRHTRSEASHHAIFQSPLAPPSSTGHGYFDLGPYCTRVGPSHYSNPSGPKMLSCNAPDILYPQYVNPASLTRSDNAGNQDSSDPGFQETPSLHPNSRESWNDSDGGWNDFDGGWNDFDHGWDDFMSEHGATVSQKSHRTANPPVSHPGISTPYNEPVAPRATGALSSQRPCPKDESASRNCRAGFEEGIMKRR